MLQAENKDRFVYLFSETPLVEQRYGSDWDTIKAILGGKGAGLAKMASIGLPVPPGFTITTEACLKFLEKQDFPPGMWEDVKKSVASIEATLQRKFGAKDRPLFLSCRSGAKFSMPGMMETILNIGIHDGNFEELSKATNPRFAADAYRRLIQGFGSVVMGIESEVFEHALKELKQSKKYKNDLDLTSGDLLGLCQTYKSVILKSTGKEFPQDPWKQLEMSIRAVFGSWNGKKAVSYRNQTGISHSLGTACNIQTMVFGNMGSTSATGVAFTRNPSTGKKELFGDYLTNAQGEDVVAGIRNCTPVIQMKQEFPECFAVLQDICVKLESYFKNMQDMEFTIQENKLWMLQTRDGKRTAYAQVVIALDMVNEGLITREEAIKRISPQDVNILLLPQLDQKALDEARKKGRLLKHGVGASPGGAVGKACFDANKAEEMKKNGEQVILVRPFTKPEDVHGFFASKGVLTSEGGATSHAAVVCRQFGIPCIVGAAINIDTKLRQFTVEGKDGIVVREGDTIALNATQGEIFLGSMPTVEANFENQKELQTILAWADEVASAQYKRGSDKKPMRGLAVWANGDNGVDARRARNFGAKGIGLVRTEHMFFELDRLPIVQEMILAKNIEAKRQALNRLLPFQRKDFYEILSAMDGLPVIIRLLDPPLHEFLPDYSKMLQEVATLKAKSEQDKSFDREFKEKSQLLANVESLHESNPMMGLRGVRVGVMTPMIYEVQVRAIIEAACAVTKEGKKAIPEIMIPLTSHVNELRKAVVPVCEKIVETVFSEQGIRIPYKFGTMIETPRAALTAGEIATVAEFFSFGTNDLTQMTFGISRDDAEREFLLEYVAKGLLPTNPFQTLDPEGVGRLIQIATTEGRATRPTLHVGICGEVGGDPASIALCHKIGLDYVSCSPFRVPVARLSAAHAALAK